MKYVYAFVFLAALFISVQAQGGKDTLYGDMLEGPVRGAVLRVVDGDTVDVRLRIWIGQDLVTRVRVDGIDAPELHGKCEAERKGAQAAKAEMERLLAGGAVVLSGIRHEKYAGRVLARVTTLTGGDVARHMLDGGFVRAYHGEKRRPWCDSLFRRLKMK